MKMRAQHRKQIHSEGLNSVGVINLKVLNGNIDDLSSLGKNEILGALLQ